MRVPGILVAAAAALLLTAAAGCGGGGSAEAPCNALCVQAEIHLSVNDGETGAPLTDSAAAGPNVSCAPDGQGLLCRAPTAGAYAIDVAAPGYATAHVSVDVASGPTPCRCPVATSAQVALSRL